MPEQAAGPGTGHVTDSTGTGSGGGSPQRIVVGVGGGIAAYKSCAVIRAFTESRTTCGSSRRSLALQFVGKRDVRGAVGQPGAHGCVHRSPGPGCPSGQEADLVVIAPATADLMARAVAGRATTSSPRRCHRTDVPVFAPAMHTEMWEYLATVANVATLRARGVTVIEPASGRLTGKDTGAARLPATRRDRRVGVVAGGASRRPAP